MIIWINGTFGVGKTTTAKTIRDLSGWRLFDPEHVGYLLAANLKDLDFDDFQDLAPWRELVPVVANKIHHYTNSSATVAVQSVLVEQYWQELSKGFAALRLPIFHVLLDCEIQELLRRIEHDDIESQARQWRLDHIKPYNIAHDWMTRSADLVVDTTNLDSNEIARIIINAVGDNG